MEPLDFVRAFGQDGARYTVLREVAFDRDTEVSWDGFVRRYNADLANDYGNLLNRTLSMMGRYLEGERVPPTANGPLRSAWSEALAAFHSSFDAYLLHEALGALWGFVGAANRFVDSEQPWTLARAAGEGDEAARQQLRGVLGDLLEACRLVSLAAAPFIPQTAPRAAAQLGIDYPYAPDGNGGPPVGELLAWGAVSATGRIGAPEPLFPRLDAEVAE
jgi:methionyl-tRNA synthetase